MKNKIKTTKALTTQVIFFILMSFIMIWIIVFGFQRITDVQDTLSQQEEIEIREELKEAFSFCSDPINQGSLKIIDLSGRAYNSICFNCINKSYLDTSYNINIDQELIDEAKILQDAGSNFLLLETSFSPSGLDEYNILGELEIKELGYDTSIAWFDFENSYAQEIEIRCE